jgi:phospholipid-binding lipoprotein MlaA
LPGPGRRLESARSLSLCVVALVLCLTGCGSVSGARLVSSGVTVVADAGVDSTFAALPLGSEADVPAVAATEATDGESPAVASEGVRELSAAPETSAAWADGEELASPVILTQAPSPSKSADDEDEDLEPYDPFERFNEVMFRFNYNLDRFVLKPVAKAYNVVMPDPWQVMIANGFDNIKVVPRVVNNLLQAKWAGAGREVARFLINSTAGVGGLFDPARDYWGIDRSREDFGQTLGRWGIKPGPFLILPILPPMTVRDGIGRGVDSLMDPLTWLLPFVWTRLGMTVGEMVNDRSLNLDLYEGFEDVTLDLYSAVRYSYLQRRERQVRD